MTKMLYVRNWTRFQHYKDRTPPWIKLHWELLASEDWVMLDDASKLLAVVCMLIASRNEGKVPNNPDYIKRVAYLDKRPNLKPLIECGFLSETLADDSESKQTQANDTTETDTESETENPPPISPPLRGGSKATRLPADWSLPDDWRDWAAKEGLPDPGREAERFRDHWHAKAGRDACKVDWQATWRNWVRNSQDFRKKRDGPIPFPQQAVSKWAI